MTEQIDWDLSESHRPSDVDWEPRSDFDGTVMEGVESVRIELADDRVFEASGNIHDVTLGNDGEFLHTLAVEFEAEDLDSAFKRALAIAKEWDLDTKNLEKFYAAASRKDIEDVASHGTYKEESLGDKNGPYVGVELRPYSEEAPALVSFQVEWVGP